MKTESSSAVAAFDRFMWDGFAGCERWLTAGRRVKSEATEPVYCEVGEWLVIADAVCVSAFNGVRKDGLGNPLTYQADLAFPNQAAARAFLAGLPKDFDPVEFGFTDAN